MTDYDQGLEPCAANYQPLSPLSFLVRSANTFPDRLAIIHGDERWSYRDFYAASCKMASALKRRGIQKGDTVSVILANTPPMLISHYGVPMSGAVLNTINTRLDPETVAFILDHAEAKVLIVDTAFSSLAKAALALCKSKPLVIDYDDEQEDEKGETISDLSFEALLDEGKVDDSWQEPRHEWDAISLNYTSGTTGNPKGVVYHHRGAYLLAMGNALTAEMRKGATYLWTLPMFHCNGWCFPWTLSVIAGTHVCLRKVRADAIFQALAEHQVTHLCGAPIVMSVLLNASADEKQQFDQTVMFLTAAAPPPEAILAAMKDEGFEVTHLYGLTETYGPAAVNEWQSDWDALDKTQQAKMKSRQGVPYIPLEGLSVIDPDTMKPVPSDGDTIGEVMFRGNVVMKGYLKNPEATKAAFGGGWFHSGDLGVMHPDGYIELKDRSKDIIISGGENISSIEVENCIYKLDGVAAVAVVAKPHEKWGETPCAFIELKPDAALNEKDVIEHCRHSMAHYKTPGLVVFDALPKTSTGKIQKFKLRDRAKAL